ncbi:MAG: AMP-binding protein, partial [Proteobacteria bacterium]|nr:AMP-binding protein [Pseudomonadota bacterium]
DERQLMVVDWNRTEAVFDGPQTVHGLFEAQARRTPAAIAVAGKGCHLSYAELDRRAEDIAQRLRAAGVASGTLVAICVRRSPDMLAGLLAILKAGCAYVPIDPTYPAERVRHVLEDAGVSLLLTQADLLATLPEPECPLLFLDDEATAPALAGKGAAGCRTVADGTIPPGLAYAIYTSGSTGKPKGVMIGHRAAVNFLQSMRRTPGIGPADRVLAVTTISFDIAVLELYLPLSVGARVVIADEETTHDGHALMQLMASEAVTLAQATPATWRMLLDLGWQGDPSLRILCGGEAFPTDLAASLRGLCGALWNMYGPTETTVWSTLQQVEGETLERASIAIGRPIANTVIRILDAHHTPQPVGVAGELPRSRRPAGQGPWFPHRTGRN